MKKSWQNTVFLYIYQVVGVYGWELTKKGNTQQVARMTPSTQVKY